MRIFRNNSYKQPLIFIIMVIPILIVTTNSHTNTPTHQHTNTPRRIISLKPNITELIFALGAGENLVGVTTWCDRPEETRNIPKVADYIRPNIERIIALKPDLVAASEENSARAPIELLRRAGIKTLVLPFKNTDDLFSSAEKLARELGKDEEGKKLLEDLAVPPSHSAGRTALILVGHRPLTAAGRQTYLSEIVELAGGRNIIESSFPYPVISMETIIAKKPDVILDFSMDSEERPWHEGPKFNSRVYPLNISDFRAGPRLPGQVKELAVILNSGDK